MQQNNHNIKELAKLFLKLGVIGFGGPSAHIAMMRNEVVYKRKWMSDEHFLDLISITNLIPGPNSTEMAIHIGHDRGGWRGLIVAGACFISPSVFLVGIIAWLYKQYGQLPEVRPFIYGINPAIIAVILAAIFPLAKKSLKTIELGIIGCIALTLSLFGANEIYVMFGAGLVGLLYAEIKNKIFLRNVKNIFCLTLLQVSGINLSHSTNLRLFWIFLKVGALLYGSGYVLFAFLDTELVTKGIISRQQLIDAIAVGQFTPGPVSSSVTFIGYQINGWIGASVSTIGIFLPSFLFIALLNPLAKKMRNSKMFSSFLDAVNIASVAVIIGVCYAIGKSSISDWRTMFIAILCLITTFYFRKLNSAFVILGGSVIGYLLLLI
jgi:chromate transporter